MNKTDGTKYLECEKLWIFFILMLVGGFYGGFTYCVRGGVFCNGQTGNLVRLGIALGDGNWHGALYYTVPLMAYLTGTVVSEAAAGPIKRLRLIRWDTLLIIVEMLTVIFLAFLPESAPFQISQVVINLICAMQYNTFRQAEGVNMATTFCTNHVRQIGIAFSRAFLHNDRNCFRRMGLHMAMVLVFVAGVGTAAVLGRYFLGRSILFQLLPLGIMLADFLYADLKKEKDLLDEVPHGH